MILVLPGTLVTHNKHYEKYIAVVTGPAEANFTFGWVYPAVAIVHQGSWTKGKKVMIPADKINPIWAPR